MAFRPGERLAPQNINVSEAVVEYITKKKADFRISTSCGGPMLLPVTYKPPKPTDIPVRAGSQTIYVSVHQFPYLTSIGIELIPRFFDHRVD